jgi:hypothetical protein
VVALGLGLRLYHFLRDPSMWHDEAALVLNVLGKSFGELLGPLDFAEAAPPLFLWLEKVVALILGDGTYALRLIPFLASGASLVLMVPVARRLLRPQAVPWALLLFACSDRLLWHACEAKPYAVDVFVATALLAIYQAMRNWPFRHQLLVYMPLAPLVIFLSYPGCFLCGALLVVLLPAAWRTGRWRDRLAYALLALVVFGAFALLYAGPVRSQRCVALDRCWEHAFPAWGRPWAMPVRTVASTLDIVRYCCGPTGHVLAVAALAGALLLWRRGERASLAVLLLPILLTLVAALFHAYPYGGARVLAYAAPALALLIGEGLSPVLIRSWTPKPVAVSLAVLVLSLLLAPVAQAAYRAVFPWPRADCAGAAAYVLSQRRTNERVLANHWEYAYYFRHLADDFTLLEEGRRFDDGPLWLIATADTPVDRLQFAHTLHPRDWHILRRYEFERTSVFLLARQAQALLTKGRPRRSPD